MKNLLTGVLCTCLLVLACDVPGRAQEQQSGDPSGQQQAPPEQTTPPTQQQTPPVQTTPPDQQTPPGQTTPPQQQTPPDQPIQRGRVPEPPPPPKQVPDVRRPGESGYFIGLSAWFPTQHPFFNHGRAATFTVNSQITLPGKPKYAEGLEFGVAVGQHNAVRVSYFEAKATGVTTLSNNDLVAWGQFYPKGSLLNTTSRFRNIKLSYEYLSWPYPVGSRKFRLKTLWQLQYTAMQSTFDAPLNYYDSNGNLILDPSTGNPVSLVGQGTRYFVSPTFGLGAHYYVSRHVRLEANGSGFAIPRRFAIWDSDASLNLRVLGHLEFRLGAKAFHFKTNTNAEYYMRGTMASAFFGLRWYSNSE